jgi:GTPase SAR1 family protein
MDRDPSGRSADPFKHLCFSHILLESHPKKVVFVGEAGVGKTYIIHHAVRREFLNQHQPTVGTGLDKLSLLIRLFRRTLSRKIGLKTYSTSPIQIRATVGD